MKKKCVFWLQIPRSLTVFTPLWTRSVIDADLMLITLVPEILTEGKTTRKRLAAPSPPTVTKKNITKQRGKKTKHYTTKNTPKTSLPRVINNM